MLAGSIFGIWFIVVEGNWANSFVNTATFWKGVKGFDIACGTAPTTSVMLEQESQIVFMMENPSKTP